MMWMFIGHLTTWGLNKNSIWLYILTVIIYSTLLIQKLEGQSIGHLFDFL